MKKIFDYYGYYVKNKKERVINTLRKEYSDYEWKYDNDLGIWDNGEWYVSGESRLKNRFEDDDECFTVYVRSDNGKVVIF